MKQYVFSFKDGNKEMKSILGGKGANLAEMTKIGLPVPYGFTISTDACNRYYDENKKMSDDIIEAIYKELAVLEEISGKKFGDTNNPLLVSVRSGAVVSMPGMMDTVLNLGLNDEAVIGLANLTGNERFAYDSYRRFIQMFGDVVLEIPKHSFDIIFDRVKEANGFESDVDLQKEHLMEVIEKYKALVLKEKGFDFPVDPKEQLMMAVEAVFDSWNNARAIIYRQLNDIPSEYGTAVNIQSMVFGNMGDTSGTGVAFTRNPVNGKDEMFGEFLINAQGEDVVAGIRTPKHIDELKDAMPEIFDEFNKTADILEAHYKDMQDIEFTVERGKLFMLQTRNGKRTAEAAIKIAVDMYESGIIDQKEAIMRVEPEQLDQLLHPTFDQKALDSTDKIAQGLPASPGAACGLVYFNSEDAVAAKNDGNKVILVRMETSPEDIEGMIASEGILTSRGGMTSHAAVVARGMGKCCVAGCSEIRVDESRKTIFVGNDTYGEGDYLSLDGNTGKVYSGQIPTIEPELSGDFEKLMSWADEIRTMKVRANADNPNDSAVAVKFGAEGIGLCRTEHMFFEEERIPAVRKMIVAKNLEDRKVALESLLPFQKEDFKGIFTEMGIRPVTIRLLDPPLHEFLPHTPEEIKNLSEQINVNYDELLLRVDELKEFNPMLGHRGCRLAVTYPEIYEMQTKAIIQAAIEISEEKNIAIIPEIMIPLIGSANELDFVKKVVLETIENVFAELGKTIKYSVGTMIEVPRAALTADEVAEHAEFFSFGTNDLTQMTYGFSRDDAGKFIGEYLETKIMEVDPFQSLDQTGVGKLVKMASELGKMTRPDIKLGICGEHGGDPKSIAFCNAIGLDYVSCSPFRVPIARLAAARAAINQAE